MKLDPLSSNAPAICYGGFIVAMRAKSISASKPSLYEWIIVCRWGTEGENVSIGWTSVRADAGEAPINLTPRQTVLAVRQERSAVRASAMFRLTSSLPKGVTLAGDFVPAQGHVLLYGTGIRLRLRSKGIGETPGLHSTRHNATWSIEATRAEWFGEFIEKKSGPGA